MNGWQIATVCILIAAIGFGFSAWMIREPKSRYRRHGND